MGIFLFLYLELSLLLQLLKCSSNATLGVGDFFLYWELGFLFCCWRFSACIVLVCLSVALALVLRFLL